MLGNILSLSLTQLGDNAILPALSTFLDKDEEVLGNFAAKGALVTFTDRKILIEFASNGDSMSHYIQIIPYHSISLCTLKTKNDFAYETTMELTVSDMGCMVLDFMGSFDTARICNHITSCRYFGKSLK